LVRQQRRDHAPFEIGQIVAAHAATLNQINAALGIPFMGSRPNYARSGAVTTSQIKAVFRHFSLTDKIDSLKQSAG
ncbi:MAG: hypothetical protein LKF30_12900, partial [Sphingobium sp.]|nr:hypothetical protein [Sphingobium sp.]MCI2054240.1 hypothetical protein [Sphingobium sp.]